MSFLYKIFPTKMAIFMQNVWTKNADKNVFSIFTGFQEIKFLLIKSVYCYKSKFSSKTDKNSVKRY